MIEYIDKWAVVDKLTALENEFQHFKPFEGFEHAMYRKLCEVEMEIGKMPAAETVQRWIPVTERLPEVASVHKHRRYTSRKSIRVLCVCVQKSGKRMVKEGYCDWYNDYPEPRWRVPGTIDSVTHWMPHPELPKEVE